MAGSRQKFTIGRDRTCDIAIASDSVSARHAELTYLDDGRLLLTDCQSRNGTFRLLPDGTEVAIRQELVSPFDRVRFGAVRLGVREILESLRLKYPGFDAAGAAAPGAAAAAPGPRVGGEPERCDCGALKPIGRPCPVCGR